MGLSREAILGADDLRTETVEVPEWGGSVTIRTMTGSDVDALQSVLAEPDGRRRFRDALLVATVVDDNGAPLFAPADVPALRTKAAAALSRVANASMRLNGLSSEAVESAEKN